MGLPFFRNAAEASQMCKAGALSPEQFWTKMTELDDRMRASATLMPLYGVAHWTGSITTGDWTWDNGRLVTVGIVHGDPFGTGRYVHVPTTSDDAESVVSDLHMAAHAGTPDQEQFLALLQRLAGSPTTPADITVDGGVECFTRWDDDDRWYAAGRHGDHAVVLEARDVAPDQINLTRVADIEPYLAGRREQLRQLRGGT